MSPLFVKEKILMLNLLYTPCWKYIRLNKLNSLLCYDSVTNKKRLHKMCNLISYNLLKINKLCLSGHQDSNLGPPAPKA